MGRNESLDIEEIKFICEQVIKGRTDRQIKSDLEEDWGPRDIRTIRLVRRIFQAGQEVIVDDLSRTGKLTQGQLGEDINRVIDIVNHMSKGLRPVYYDKGTGKVEYETWLEL